MPRLKLPYLALIATLTLFHASTLAQRRDAPLTATTSQTLVVRADRMLDVTSGRIIPNAVVVVENGRMTSAA